MSKERRGRSKDRRGMWKDTSRGSVQFLDVGNKFVPQNVVELRRNELVEFYRCHLAVYAKTVAFDHLEMGGPQPTMSRGDAFEQT